MKKLKEEDFESLYQFIIDSDYNEYIVLTDIKGIKEYFKTLNDKSALEVIKNLFTLENKENKLMENIIYFSSIFVDLEKLSIKIKGDSINLDELSNQLKDSTFFIKLSSEKNIYELISIKTNNEKDEIIDNYNQLILEKSFFSLSHSLLKADIYNKYKKILEQNNYIKEYISLLNSRRNIIYAKDEEIKLKIINDEIMNIIKNKSIKELIKLIKNEEESEDNILIDFYKNNKYIRLFSSLQLYKLYQLIKEEQYDEIKKIFSPFITNPDIHYEIFNEININKSDNIPFREKIENISKYFDKITNSHMNYNDIFIKNKIKEEFINNYKNNIIYIKSFNDNEYEPICLNIFFYLTGNLPCFSNIFIYNEETIKHEFLPFLYKVVKTDLNCLFIMILKECKNSNEDKVLIKINELLSTKRNSIFILLYSKQNIFKIEKFINANTYEKFEFNNNDYKENIKEILKDKIELVYSDLSGTGKTTYIKNLIKININYIYFPLNGHLNIKTLIKRLKSEIQIDEKKINLIHIDLYDSINENIIKEFLFHFLFFKFFGQDKNIFNYGYYEENRIHIIIELQNTYKNYFDKYKILYYIPIKKLISESDIKAIPTLNQKGNCSIINDSDIQIVSVVLSLYKNKNIRIKNLDLQSDQLMNNDNCENIINETLINIVEKTNLNYYQKINFIKLLSSEFKKFTKCPDLCTSVFDYGIPKYFANLREKIVYSIIKNSKYIIELNFLEKEFFERNKTILIESDREKNFEEISGKIIKEKNKQIKNIDTLEPSLICMHNSERFLSVISSNNNSEILKNINFHIKEINSNYSKYDNYKPQDYLENLTVLEKDENKKKLSYELFKMIIDENLEGDGKYKKVKDALDYNFKDFVFTKDNFIKIVLLFLRIRAGISTIIMGETGCGKTYLVKMFSMIFGQNAKSMYTLKFHSGITSDDVINFITKTMETCEEDEKRIIEELNEFFGKDKDKNLESFRKKEQSEYDKLAFFQKWFFDYSFEQSFRKYDENVRKDNEKKIKNRKIIIFFDEVNTSNSLDIVKRIICDEHFRKQILKIPDRFIIICACNPYRVLQESNQNLQFGLSIRNQKKRKLVYTVNPLPYSMINFVLYFNDLSKETTLKYIEKMNESIECKIEISSKNRELRNKLVYDSHFFIINKGDISSVSLREINRFGKLFSFFNEEYLKKYRKSNSEKNELEIQSIALSLYFCYYLRLPSTELRKYYIKEVIKKNIDFIKICEKETKFITDQVLYGKKGYAKNKGLCENIFSEFICILIREPLIICGKPGSSKSLSVRLVLNAMKGEKSKIDFFKQFPEVLPSFYQCSLTS